ncbi:DUF2924 domain-containing protein [Novosphingobium olei]|uniref:DUF2924 domain-containing protein n=1 Tax=Novosphingobium olei TaxID=2728851 RepID=A0A7Y0BSE5_9SPHN|nr:DUF2924 domain-containing protein [Novosphingobium olei]NML95669.1 DUF2924 domain-containing protein [Novosphingobium olei]
MSRAKLEAQLQRLDALTTIELRAAWIALTNIPAPRVSPKLLRLALAWEIQTRLHGGLQRSTTRLLDQTAAGKSRTRTTRKGMRLVREWNGTVYVVEIGEDGVINWDGRTWKSLSEVARAITGTRWSGPAFFGLRQNRKAA